MKKLLIASAALAMVAGTAQAQSSVTVYGVLDIGVSEVKNESTTSGVTTTSKINNTGNGDGSLATSRLGFRGVEDLGAGRKAKFQLEYDLTDAGTGSTRADGQAASATTSAAGTAYANLGARYSWVGLEDAKLGELRLGQQETSMHSVFAAGLAGGANNAAGSIYSSSDTVNSISDISARARPYDVFVSRAITYISPKIGGFTVEGQTANYKTDAGTPGAVTDLRVALNAASLKYSAGKLNLAAAVQTTKVDSSATANDVNTREGTAISANYDFGVVRGFAVYSTDKQTQYQGVRHDTKATEVGLQLPVGKTTFWASAFDGNRKGTGLTTAADAQGLATRDADLSGYQVGVRNDLSKRTAVYAIYGQQEIKGTAAANNTNKLETTGMSVGVRHSF